MDRTPQGGLPAQADWLMHQLELTTLASPLAPPMPVLAALPPTLTALVSAAPAAASPTVPAAPASASPSLTMQSLVANAGGVETLHSYVKPHGVNGKPCAYTFLGFQIIIKNIKAYYSHTVKGTVIMLLMINTSAYTINQRLTKECSKSKSLNVPTDLWTLAQLEAA
jgi:hypothetical protein